MASCLRPTMLRQLLGRWLFCLLIMQQSMIVTANHNTKPTPTVASGRRAAATSSQQQQQQLPSVSTAANVLTSSAKQVDSLKCSVIGFWQAHGADGSNGMHATLTRQGQPAQPTVKPLVAQSRHLWAFTNFAANLQGRQSVVAAMTQAQAQFLIRSFTDPADGCFFSEVTRDGSNVTDRSKTFVDQTPAIFALAAYAKQFNDPAALKAAMAAFIAWDAAVHDALHGGYFDATVPAGGSVKGLAKSQAVIKQAKTRRKALNTQLHALLMIMDLVKADPGNTLLQDRLAEMAGVLTTAMVVKPAGSPEAMYLANTYAADWSDPSRQEVAYFGILAEYVWYTLAAVDLAVQVGAINTTAAQQATATALAVGATTLKAGYDAEYGGLLHAAILEPAAKSQALPTLAAAANMSDAKTEKYWWVQLEGALAMMAMFRSTGNQAYLDMLQKTLAFISDHLWDNQYGELYMVADRTGQLWGEVACGAAGKVSPGAIKACGNKSSWHTGRAFVQLCRWLLDEGVQGMPHCNL